AEAKKSKPLVIYSGRGKVLVGPLLEQFSKKTGIEVQVRYEKSTEVLANRLATEGAQTEADVFFAQDSGWLGALAKAGHIAPLSQELLEQIPAHYRDAGGRWVGTSGRARVLVYSSERVKTTDLPKTLEELSTGPWKGRLGWAPSNGSYQAHVSALRHIWGEEKTRKWLTAVKGLNPTVYPKNSPQVKAVSNGEIDMGWVNHYYLHKLRAANPELKAANYSFTAAGDPGNLMMLSGVAITAHTKNQANAQALVEFLISAAAQDYFAQKTFEYPTRAGVKLHPDVPPIGDRLVRADQTHLTDLSGTLEMLRSLGLQ
ncbi:MAG: extracellular solute-binding protein, partial [Myxococcota bacterium]|nr:extracellular solute-binding protein [Myxococcota bacterium]